MKYDVFISHSSKDKPFAESLQQHLMTQGVSCWIDNEGICAGDDWTDSIAKALLSSLALVLVYSSNSIESDNVKDELSMAAKRKLIIIPIRIEDIEPNEFFEMRLSRYNWLNIFENQQEKLRSVAESIKVRIDKEKQKLTNNDSSLENSVAQSQQAQIDVRTKVEKEPAPVTGAQISIVSWPAIGNIFLKAINKELNVVRLPFTPTSIADDEFIEDENFVYWQINDHQYMAVWLNTKSRRLNKINVCWGYYSEHEKRDPIFRNACNAISKMQDALNEDGIFSLNGYAYEFVSDGYLGFETSERATFEEMSQDAFVKRVANQLVAFTQKIWPVIWPVISTSGNPIVQAHDVQLANLTPVGNDTV